MARRLSQELVCDTHNIISGNLGLMVGFLIAAYGLYKMIASNDMKGGLIFIIVGALFTATPGLILSFFDGMGLALGNLTEVHSISKPYCLQSNPRPGGPI